MELYGVRWVDCAPIINMAREWNDQLILEVATGTSGLGAVLVAGGPRGVCAVEVGDSVRELLERLRARYPVIPVIRETPRPRSWLAVLLGQIQAPHPNFELPLDVLGTRFQRQVWEYLQEIPLGSTLSHSDLAVKIGRPGAARAVAQACACNRVALAIPCHRVVGSNGSLCGYRWGSDRKRQLLEIERQSAQKLLG